MSKRCTAGGFGKRVNHWFAFLNVDYSNSLSLLLAAECTALCNAFASNGGVWFMHGAFHQHCLVQESMKPTISVYNALYLFWTTNIYNESTSLYRTAEQNWFLLGSTYSPKPLRHIKTPRPVC
jgi:hypothetical protein